MLNGMKITFGPSVTKIAPLKSATGFTITDRIKQMERWADHYQELYSRETMVTVQNTTTGCDGRTRHSTVSIVGKVFARVALNRLQSLAERVYPEAQCGFRAGRSTIDMIVSLWQLQEKCLRWFNQGFQPGKHKRPLHNAAKDWVSSKTSENHHVLPRRHDRYYQHDKSRN